jgi:hypothetical protein
MSETQMPQTELQSTRQAAQIINAYDQLRVAVETGLITKEQAVGIGYRPRPPGRMGWCQVNHTVVYSPFFKTNPSSAWYDHGNKTFSGNRAESFPKAKEWASRTYGITEWKPNAMRDHVPRVVQESFPIRKR